MLKGKEQAWHKGRPARGMIVLSSVSRSDTYPFRLPRHMDVCGSMSNLVVKAYSRTVSLFPELIN